MVKTGPWKIDEGGDIIPLPPGGACVDVNAGMGAVEGPYYHVVVVTNQNCLYKLWMCACFASQIPGCLCAKENNDGSGSVTMIKPVGGDCPDGSGPLLNPKAYQTGGVALQCTNDPCQACCGKCCCSDNVISVQPTVP
jgi:hypothetical protein